MKIGIAGVGGIGSNVAVHLVRAGIKDFKLADFDKVEKSNLNRQFYFQDQIGQYKVDMLEENLKRINDSVSIEKMVLKLDKANMKEFYEDCDIIVEGFDVKELKKELLEVFAFGGKTVVSANGIGGMDTDNIKTKQLGNNIFVVGDFESDIENNDTFSPKVNIVAAIMANIVLKKCVGVRKNV